MSWGHVTATLVRWTGLGRLSETLGEIGVPGLGGPDVPVPRDPNAPDARACVGEAPCRRESVARRGGTTTPPDSPTPSTVAVGDDVLDAQRIDLQPDDVLVTLGCRAAERGDDRSARDWFEQAAWSEEAILRLAELDLRAGRADDALDRVEREREILSHFGPRRASDDTGLGPDVLEAWWAWVEGEAAFRLGDLDRARRRLSGAVGAPGDRGEQAAARLAEVGAPDLVAAG